MVRVFFVLVMVAVACELARADNKGCQQVVDEIDIIFDAYYGDADSYEMDTYERCEVMADDDQMFDACNFVLTDCGL